jgi:diguanylate cyclase (GGDEF)-like protein
MSHQESINTHPHAESDFDETSINIPYRLSLLSLTPKRIAKLKSQKAFISASIEDIVETFYIHQLAIDEIASIIAEPYVLQRLKNLQKDYVIKLFSGDYDYNYVTDRLKIGSIHKKLGIKPKLYLASMAYLSKTIKKVLREHIIDIDEYISVCEVLDDVFSFDTTLVFETYIGGLLGELENKHKKIEIYAESLERQVNLDPMTGIYNQPAMLTILDRELSSLSRQEAKLSLLYFDIDDFKFINDNFGHQMGDEVIKTTGRLLSQLTREMDTPCRYGGDEFCVVLPACELSNAEKVARKFITKFEQAYPDFSVSIGIQSTATPIPAIDFIKNADQKMYEAKQLSGSAISF